MVKFEDSRIVVIRLLIAFNWIMLENVIGCQLYEFECTVENICINITLRCNLDFDCPDFSDEDNCVFRQVCPEGEFRCRNGLCVVSDAKCNGIVQCPDGSDEDICVSVQSTTELYTLTSKEMLTDSYTLTPVSSPSKVNTLTSFHVITPYYLYTSMYVPVSNMLDYTYSPILKFVQTSSDLYTLNSKHSLLESFTIPSVSSSSELYTFTPAHSSLDSSTMMSVPILSDSFALPSVFKPSSYSLTTALTSLFLEFIPIPSDSYNVTVVTTLTSSVVYSSFNKRVSEMYLTLMTPVNTILPPVYEMDVSVSDKRSVFSASAVSSQYNMIIESTHSIEPVESTTLVSSKPIVAAVSEGNKRDIWIPTIIAIAVLICLIIIIVLAYKYREQIRMATRNNTVGDRLNMDMNHPDMDVESSGQPSKAPLLTIFSYKVSTTDTNVKEKTDISLYL